MNFNRLKSNFKLKSQSVHVLLALLLVFVLATSIIAVDIGTHWDEGKVFKAIRQSCKIGVLLPLRYNYPSMLYDLSIFCLVPSMARFFNSHGFNQNNLNALLDYLSDISKTHQFHMNLRILCIIVSLASCIWIYLLVLFWRKNWIEALLAASLVGLSWEVAYHLRWIAPDAILMQFGILTVMCLFFSQHFSKSRLWLYLAAFSAGLGCGTKYPGGLLLVPLVLGTYFYSKKNAAAKVQWFDFLAVLAVFCLAYSASTPGTFLDPVRFINSVTFEIEHYKTGHMGYTVSPGIQHLFLVLIYFSLAVSSRFRLISVFFFIMSLVGVFSLLREDWKFTSIFFSFPVLYLLYMTSQKVMIVRNFLIIIPFFAVLAARGFIFLTNTYIKARFYSVLCHLVIVAFLLTNAFWLVRATISIVNRDSINYMEQLADYLDRHQDKKFSLSKPIMDELQAFDNKPRSNIIQGFSDKAGIAVFRYSEVKDISLWTCNRFNYITKWFGPYEINLNYYPTWVSNDRIIVMPIKSALGLKVFST